MKIKDIECDYVLVKIRSEFNNIVGSVKNELGEEVSITINIHWKPEQGANICAEVIAAPRYLSGRQDPLYEIYQGCPKAVAFRGGDALATQIAMMPPKYRTSHNLVYCPGMGKTEYATLKDEPVEVPVGSKVYFHYNSLLNQENYLDRDKEGNLIYKIPYHVIFCYVVGNGEPQVINNYCLVSPYFEDEMTEIEVPEMDGFLGKATQFARSTLKVKMQGEIIVGLNEEQKYLTGVVRYFGRSIGPDKRSLYQDQLIMYRPSSEFINIIEGVAYFVMRQTDIVATWLTDRDLQSVIKIAAKYGEKVEVEQIVPVGDYVMIDPEEQSAATKSSHIILDPTNPNQQFKQGDLFVLGHHLERKKKTLKFGIGTLRENGENCETRNKGRRVMFEKSGFYLYVQEFNKIFIREKDVYGYFD